MSSPRPASEPCHGQVASIIENDSRHDLAGMEVRSVGEGEP